MGWVIQALLIDRDYNDAALFQALLSYASVHVPDYCFQMSHLAGVDEALRHIEQFAPDVILIDIADGGIEDLFQIHQRAQQAPVIPMSARFDKEFIDQMSRVGIEDYVIKTNLNSKLLAKTILCAIERQRFNKQVIQTRKKLAQTRRALEKQARNCQEQLARLSAESQKKAEQRERTERALAEQLQHLADANTELKQLISIVSHDLRQPLYTIIDYLKLLEREYAPLPDTDADQYIRFVINSANRMRDLIRDLLTYSRVDMQEKKEAVVDCNLILGQVLLNLEQTIRANEAQVKIEPLPVVIGDKTQLLQLFQNLIDNAIKFRSDRRPEILVAADLDPEKKEWVFSVQDNGIGVESEHRERIFTIFERLHTEDEYPGTGIGLAISRKVIQRHGGRIRVEANPIGGSIFYFTIPNRSPAKNASGNNLHTNPDNGFLKLSTP